MLIKKYLSYCQQWLLPYTCILCHHLAERAQDLCQHCLESLPILPDTCPKCANLLHAGGDNITCGHCLHHTPPFDVTHALWSYQPPIPHLITQLKFQKNLVIARILGELMANAVKNHWYRDKPLPDLIIPIPLHPQRLRERGYNQALEIARPLRHYLNLPLSVTHCSRTKYTTPQTITPATERKKNVQSAFSAQRSLKNTHIALVDDVVTTGHTISAAAAALKRAGARQIDIWCCAKTL